MSNVDYFFQELTCLTDGEISPGFVMGKVMEQLHLRMVEISGGGLCPIGISFPGYRPESDSKTQLATDELPSIEEMAAAKLPIGTRLRLFARPPSDLERLNLALAVQHLADYVHVTSIRPLERAIQGFAIYRRYQPKGPAQRLIRRQMKRQGISEYEAQRLYASYKDRRTRIPYVNMRSLSTDRRFRLYIERKASPPSNGDWGFSTYGLSSRVAVPEF